MSDLYARALAYAKTGTPAMTMAGVSLRNLGMRILSKLNNDQSLMFSVGKNDTVEINNRKDIGTMFLFSDGTVNYGGGTIGARREALVAAIRRELEP